MLLIFYPSMTWCSINIIIGFHFMWGCNVFTEPCWTKTCQENDETKNSRSWKGSDLRKALITQLDQRDADCDFAIRPTRHRLRLNQSLPVAQLCWTNPFQQAAPNSQSDTNETVAGWTKGPKPLFMEAQRPLWSSTLWGPVEPYTVGTPLTTETCHHILGSTLMSLNY